jgi:DNA-binding FrmR family transcriptional regulator
MIAEPYIEAIIRVAEQDASIARVLRDICALSAEVRAGALELVGAHLRTQAAAADVLQCVQALREDAVAHRIAERLGPPAG